MSAPHASLVDIGVLKSTLLPNLKFHTALAVPAYFLARATDRVEIKDHLWFTGQLLNAWWTAIGKSIIVDKVPARVALNSVSRPGWIILSGVTLWSLRLWYRVLTRRARSDRHDDPRYDEYHQNPSSWNTSIPLQFLLEAAVQSLIALPFTAPFRGIPALGIRDDLASVVEGIAIGLWSAGFALEAMADTQLAKHQRDEVPGLMRSGVWSIVRHPNYLGDALTHFSYPIYLFSQTLFNPITLLGPVTNWFFLRYVGGDKQNEQHQEEKYAQEDPLKRVELAEYRDEKNAFWPGLSEIVNPWTWAVIGSGVAGVIAARTAPLYFK